MKRQSLQDERILAQRRKISSEAYGLLMMVLLVSILVQQYLFNAPFEQYAVEFICFFGISIYVLIRNLTLGINIFGEGKNAQRMPLLNSLVAGSMVTVINGVMNYIRYAENYKGQVGNFIFTLVITFVCATVAAFAVFSIFNLINNNKQKQIQKRLDEEEQDN
ncbi:MAG: DUF6773 family protein [Syntrophomonadaceae bacterium]|nr:DUF6773 family protein [Syntrophomonadaceae bacterium]